MKKIIILAAVIFITMAFTTSITYPIDGYSHTGIKRLKRLERIKSGEIKDVSNLPPGAFKSYLDIELNLLLKKSDSVTQFLNSDKGFQDDISSLFRGLDKSYSLAVLDISDIENLRYAFRNETLGYQPGSVGKIAVLVGLFDQLAKIYPR